MKFDRSQMPAKIGVVMTKMEVARAIARGKLDMILTDVGIDIREPYDKNIRADGEEYYFFGMNWRVKR